MSLRNIFKLDFKLQKFSVISIAGKLWERQNIKIREFFEKSYSEEGLKDIWTDLIVKHVLEMVSSLGLPVKLMDDVKSCVYSMGGVIFGLIYRVTKMGFDINFGLNFYWTPDGRIDDYRMCKEWVRGSSEKRSLSYFDNVFTPEIVLRLRMVKINDLQDRSMIIRTENDKRITEEMRRRFHLVRPPARTSSFAKMFDFCFERDDTLYENWYFWHNPDIHWKQQQAAPKGFPGKYFHKENVYMIQKQTEALLFFLSVMSDEDVSVFMWKFQVPFFEALLHMWPHQELCLNVIEYYYGSTYRSQTMSCALIDLVMKRLSGKRPFPAKYESNFYRVILLKLLEKAPIERKLAYVREKLWSFDLMESFHREFDCATISLILNDVSLREIRHEVLFGNFHAIFKSVVWDEDFYFLAEYINCVLVNEEETQLFKQKLDWIDELVSRGKFRVAAKLLNLIYDSENERKNRKNRINYMNFQNSLSRRNSE